MKLYEYHIWNQSRQREKRKFRIQSHCSNCLWNMHLMMFNVFILISLQMIFHKTFVSNHTLLFRRMKSKAKRRWYTNNSSKCSIYFPTIYLLHENDVITQNNKRLTTETENFTHFYLTIEVCFLTEMNKCNWGIHLACNSTQVFGVQCTVYKVCAYPS